MTTTAPARVLDPTITEIVMHCPAGPLGPETQRLVACHLVELALDEALAHHGVGEHDLREAHGISQEDWDTVLADPLSPHGESWRVLSALDVRSDFIADAHLGTIIGARNIAAMGDPLGECTSTTKFSRVLRACVRDHQGDNRQQHAEDLEEQYRESHHEPDLDGPGFLWDDAPDHW